MIFLKGNSFEFASLLDSPVTGLGVLPLVQRGIKYPPNHEEVWLIVTCFNSPDSPSTDTIS